MLPLIPNTLEDFIRSAYGDHVLKLCTLTRSGEEAQHVPPAWASRNEENDAHFFRILSSCARALGKGASELAREFGRSLVTAAVHRGYGNLLGSVSPSIVGALHNLSNLHMHIALGVPVFLGPDLWVDQVAATSLELHHRSTHPHNLGHLIEGIVQGLALDYFGGMAVDMKLLRGRSDGSCDHEVWSVTYPPQTAVMDARAKDAAAAEAAIYAMDAPTFHRLHPFHMLLDSCGRVLQAGSALQRVVPACRPGAQADEVFKVMFPYAEPTYPGLAATAGHSCVLQMRCGSGLQLKGQWVVTRVRRAAGLQATTSDAAGRARSLAPNLQEGAGSSPSTPADGVAASSPKAVQVGLFAASSVGPLTKTLMSQVGANAASAVFNAGFGAQFRARPQKTKQPTSCPNLAAEASRSSFSLFQNPRLPSLVTSPLEVGVVGKNSASSKWSTNMSSTHATVTPPEVNTGSLSGQPAGLLGKKVGNAARHALPGVYPNSMEGSHVSNCSTGMGGDACNNANGLWVEALLFVGSPRVTTLAELGCAGLYLEDIPLHDMSSDFVVLAEQRGLEAAAKARLETANTALEARAQLLDEQNKRVEAANERLEEALQEALTERTGEGATRVLNRMSSSMVTVHSPAEQVLRLLDSLLYGAEVPMSEVMAVRDAVLSAGMDLLAPANAHDQVAAGLDEAGLGDDEVQAALRQMLWSEEGGRMGITDDWLEGGSCGGSGDELWAEPSAHPPSVPPTIRGAVKPQSMPQFMHLPSGGLEPEQLIAAGNQSDGGVRHTTSMMLIDMDGGCDCPVPAGIRPRPAAGVRALSDLDAAASSARPRTAGGTKAGADKVRFGSVQASDGECAECPSTPAPQPQPQPPAVSASSLLSPRNSKLLATESDSLSQLLLPTAFITAELDVPHAGIPSVAVGGVSGLLRARQSNPPLSAGQDSYNMLQAANESNASSQQLKTQPSFTATVSRARSARRMPRRSMSRLDLITIDAANLLKPPDDPVARVLAKVDSWHFDTWELADVSCGRPLSTLSYALLQRAGLITRFKLSEARLARWLIAIEDGYRENPYHNNIHAADVLRTMHYIMTRGGVASKLGSFKDLGLLAAYTAATVHDYEHKGLNNDYLVKSGDELAMRYNDRSPMENHHVASAWALMRSNNMNAFLHTPQKTREALRRLVIELVLATDMKQHFTFVSLFNTKLPALLEIAGHRTARPPLGGAQTSPARLAARQDPKQGLTDSGQQRAEPHMTMGTVASLAHAVVAFKRLLPKGNNNEKTEESLIVDEDQRILVMQMALKCADLGHLAHEQSVHRRWVAALEEELFRQGDAEKAAGLPVSPLMDRGKAGVSKSQAGFYSVVVLPQLQAFCRVFPSALPMLQCAYANFLAWKGEAA